MSFKLLGVGSPLVDYSLEITDTILNQTVPDGKGCTRNISHQERDTIIRYGKNICRTAGGSAANTVRALAHLGGKGALFGKAGCDADGDFFRSRLCASGADDALLLTTENNATGYCLSLVTPDAERTMLSNLGASLDLTVNELDIPLGDFDFLLLEGYLACETWSIPLLEKSRALRIPIALDLNNFELVRRKREHFRYLVDNFVDLLFANEEEIKALLDVTNLDNIEQKLNLPQAVVKLGKNGSLLIAPPAEKVIPIPPAPTEKVVDTTGAGDFYAAGYFLGRSRGLCLEKCCKIGALCASAIISCTGTELSEEQWNNLIINIDREVKP